MQFTLKYKSIDEKRELSDNYTIKDLLSDLELSAQTVVSKQNGCLTWDEALAYADNTPIEAVQRRAAMINKHDVCNMQYTSGTTGFPKGVMLTHYNVVNNGKAIGDCMDLSTADRMMIQVPMFHCFGMVLAMTASMTHGVTMSPFRAFSPRLGL